MEIILIILLVLAIIGTIISIGEPRKPLTKQVAICDVIIYIVIIISLLK